jgi:hypothetical protein
MSRRARAFDGWADLSGATRLIFAAEGVGLIVDSGTIDPLPR